MLSAYKTYNPRENWVSIKYLSFWDWHNSLSMIKGTSFRVQLFLLPLIQLRHVFSNGGCCCIGWLGSHKVQGACHNSGVSCAWMPVFLEGLVADSFLCPCLTVPDHWGFPGPEKDCRGHEPVQNKPLILLSPPVSYHRHGKHRLVHPLILWQRLDSYPYHLLYPYYLSGEAWHPWPWSEHPHPSDPLWLFADAAMTFTALFPQAQAGWLQHDYGHLSVYKKSIWNHIVHKFVIGHLKVSKGDDSVRKSLRKTWVWYPEHM